MKTYDDLIVVNEDGANTGIYKAVKFDDEITVDDLKLDYAYILEPYFYLYRGTYISAKKSVLPGLYKTVDGEVKMVKPFLSDDKKTYNASTHWSRMSPSDIVKAIEENEADYSMYSNGKNLFLPEITANDDVRKRALKEALLVKCVDLDQCKDRFSNRNEMFNLKSNIKNEKTDTTAKIFARGTDILGLDYYIVLCERDPNHSIGVSLDSEEGRKMLERVTDKYGVISNFEDVLKNRNYIVVSDTDMYKNIV